MTTRRLGIIMNGVTGRMGTNQHLIRSVLAIRAQGGVSLKNGDRVMPDPILIGRNAEKTAALAKQHSVERWSIDLDKALADKNDELFFDAATTQMRPALLEKAIKAGKHIYCEKPTATTLAEALKVVTLAEKAKLKNGVVQDKLFLPGLMKLQHLRDTGFFGRMLAVRGEFGYWVFPGDEQPAQRPSWNYKKDEGGGIILDMLCHWRYVLDNVFAPVKSVSCRGVTHFRQRWDDNGKPYKADADDAAYATFELEGGVIAHVNSSWCVRPYRDDLVTFQVDGTDGSAIAALHDCMMQRRQDTPRPVWNPDVKQPLDLYASWQPVPDFTTFDNGFKVQWEMFIRHMMEDAPYKYTLREGAKGLQLVEAATQSWKERRWVDIPPLGDAA
ncbi:MAG: Gfo/Idh/MocA family oxidoreductase [Pseudolabrys sp.]|nr:Gfo/Idh/MocA family oxidoreductase [Pseudolabrys sp.]